MRPDRLVFSTRGARARPSKAALALVALLACAFAAPAQTPKAGACKNVLPPGVKADAPVPEGERVGIRLVVTGADGTPLQRKRFFLLERSAAAADASAAPRRADYLKGASPQLVEWLGRHDCDSIYCPEYESEYAAAVKTVPEFKRAYDDGLRKYRSESLALRWVTVNFPLKDARTAYYKSKRAWLERAAAKLGGAVGSVMTDEKGVAYFTNLKPGSYYVSNLAPLEAGGLVWDCAVKTAPQLSRLLYSVTVEMSAPKQQSATPK